MALLFALALLPPASALAASGADYSLVRVKLTTNNATSIVMSVTGEYFIKENGAVFKGGSLTLRSNSDGTITVSHSSSGELYVGASVSIMRTDMSASAGSMYFNSRRYLGHFYVKRLSAGYIQVVNEVPMAQYLYGVVAYEMNNLYPLDALRAQAIAAKCYVMCSIASAPDASYHIGDTSSDQVYKGYNSSYTAVIKAIDSTIDYVLTVGGSVLRTFYSASNGGETSLPTYAWPTKNRSNSGYAIALDDYDLVNELSLAEKVTIPIRSAGTISDSMFKLILAKAYSVLGVVPDSIAEISSCELYSPKYSGVARNMTKVSMTVSVACSGTVYTGVDLTFSVSDLYTYGVVTNANLRSYWGELSSDGSKYTIYHVRFGHGVGLSQRGAEERANRGESLNDILAFYYPGAKLAELTIPEVEAPAKPASTSKLSAIGTAATTASVNLRTGASSDMEALGKLAKGTALTVYEISSGWYHVSVDGTSYEGWVAGDYVSYSPLASATPTPTPDASSDASVTVPDVVAYGTLTSSGVNFRQGPSTGYKVVKVLSKGDELSIINSSGGWYYALAGSDFGYVSGSYVSITKTVDTSASQTDAPAPESTVTADTSDYETGVITSSGVNFRTGPDTSYSSIQKLAKNTAVTVISKKGNWYYVYVGSQMGCVHADYVKITGTASSASVSDSSSSSGEGRGTTSGSVNLRSGAATSYSKLQTLSAGVSLTLYELSGGWYRVKTSSGAEGWVSSKYVSVTVAPSASASAGDAESDRATGTGVANSKVNFRESPNTSSKIITTLTSGTKVTLYELSGSWYSAEYNGRRGYLYAKYITLGEEASSAVSGEAGSVSSGVSSGVTSAAGGLTLASGTTSGKLNMRTKPSTSSSGVITTLASGARFSIIGECGEWYYILYDGRTGYVYRAYATLVSSGSADIPTVGETLTLMATATSANVNLRAGRSTASAKIATLQKGDAVTVYLVLDSWCLVNANGTMGYAYKDYIKLG